MARQVQLGSSFYRTEKRTFTDASWVKAVEGQRAQGWCHLVNAGGGVTAAMRYLWEHNVIVLLFPPHCSHVLQPCDGPVFALCKGQFSRLVQEAMNREPGLMLGKEEFPGLFFKAFKQSMTPDNIIASFRITGVVPLNPARAAMSEKLRARPTTRAGWISALSDVVALLKGRTAADAVRAM